MSLSSQKKIESIFRTVYFNQRKFFQKFVFYLNVQCIECTFRIYILLRIKKHYFIHFCCLFFKSSKTFSASLILSNSFFWDKNIILNEKNLTNTLCALKGLFYQRFDFQNSYTISLLPPHSHEFNFNCRGERMCLQLKREFCSRNIKL